MYNKLKKLQVPCSYWANINSKETTNFTINIFKKEVGYRFHEDKEITMPMHLQTFCRSNNDMYAFIHKMKIFTSKIYLYIGHIDKKQTM